MTLSEGAARRSVMNINGTIRITQYTHILMYIIYYYIIILCTYYVCCVKNYYTLYTLSDLILILLTPIKCIRSCCKIVTYTKFIAVYTLFYLRCIRGYLVFVILVSTRRYCFYF